MKLVHKIGLSRNEKQRTKFARQMAAVENHNWYCGWRTLDTFRDRTPGQIEEPRRGSPQQQLKFGKKHRVPNWFTSS